MLAGRVGRIGAAARRGIGASRRGLSTPPRVAKTEKAGEEWTANQIWLRNRICEFEASSSKELHELHQEVMKLERELNTLNAETRNRKAKMTANMMEYAVLTVGTVGIFGMHLHLLYNDFTTK